VIAAALLVMQGTHGISWPTPVSELSEDCRIAEVVTTSGSRAAGDPGAVGLHLGRCYGYIQGFMNAFTAWAQSGPAQDMCIPKEVTLQQLAKVFLKYANDNPAKLHEKADSALVRAFSDAWPCPKKK
jgi:hypothetical protein